MFRRALHNVLIPRGNAQRQKTRLRLELLEARTTPTVLLVDDNFTPNPGQHRFNSIQAAVNAANPGDHIKVFSGTYTEQVTISKNHLDIDAIGQAIIKAPTTFADPTEAIVHVSGARGVELNGFTIMGNSAATNGADFGVLVDGGGKAEISRNRITNITDPSLSNGQGSVALQFGFTNSAGDTVSIGTGSASRNVIDQYQKGGIVVIGSLTTGNTTTRSNADISRNTVTGLGPTSTIAQNGIQVSSGARGKVSDNVVSGNQFTGPDFESTGIIVFNTSDVKVTDNKTFANDEGILLFDATGVKVSYNSSRNNTFNGIGVLGGSGNKIEDNDASRNGFDGINLENTTGNIVKDNRTFQNGRAGIFLEATATGNIIKHNHMKHNNPANTADGADAVDLSTGTGTAGTANTWRHNRFRTSSPAGLH